MRAFKLAMCSIFVSTTLANATIDYHPTAVINKPAAVGSFVLNEDQKKEVECLAKNIYFEAGNQSVEGKVAVAFVTLNRAKSGIFPSNVCDVVYQAKYKRSKQNPKQWVPIKYTCSFSWHCDETKGEITEEHTWEVSYGVAYYLYRYHSYMHDITNGALFYHAYYVKPTWRNKFDKTVVVEDHIFYKLKDTEG